MSLSIATNLNHPDPDGHFAQLHADRAFEQSEELRQIRQRFWLEEMNRGFEMTPRRKEFLGMDMGSAYWDEIASAKAKRTNLKRDLKSPPWSASKVFARKKPL